MSTQFFNALKKKLKKFCFHKRVALKSKDLVEDLRYLDIYLQIYKKTLTTSGHGNDLFLQEYTPDDIFDKIFKRKGKAAKYSVILTMPNSPMPDGLIKIENPKLKTRLLKACGNLSEYLTNLSKYHDNMAFQLLRKMMTSFLQITKEERLKNKNRSKKSIKERDEVKQKLVYEAMKYNNLAKELDQIRISTDTVSVKILDVGVHETNFRRIKFEKTKEFVDPALEDICDESSPEGYGIHTCKFYNYKKYKKMSKLEYFKKKRKHAPPDYSHNDNSFSIIKKFNPVIINFFKCLFPLFVKG